MNDQATDLQTGADEAPADAGPRYQRFDCTDPQDRAAIGAAANAARHAVEAGECVVLPTDTVYGIGADAYNAEAVQRLLDAKGRGRDMPPPVLIADPGVLKALTSDVPESAQKLVTELWPGALTIICTAHSSLRMDLGETRGTVAVRVPDHPLTRELLRQTGPMAVSSANRTGRPSAVSCDDAIDQLGDSVAVYLDAGEVSGTSGKPSTMIDFTVKETGQILRRGALDLDLLRQYLPDIEDLSGEPEPEPTYTVEQLRARHTLQPPVKDGSAG
ncbi:threonylcarbamoyl-AMP synthase [Microlunatus elymi]|uniref:L-threonylcarbamoyladenylate synthase n=1 Tax=Microlunatus elymi TaxID=2596828 RepID=A0A516Q0Y3_9ACTN|nr:L-threonylcarbamoyladenylate synthase [Microlunatus elymi]QDP97058.1 threonylcarbamoyl-AMP synthase [Microlunatus elymi]